MQVLSGFWTTNRVTGVCFCFFKKYSRQVRVYSFDLVLLVFLMAVSKLVGLEKIQDLSLLLHYSRKNFFGILGFAI